MNVTLNLFAMLGWPEIGVILAVLLVMGAVAAVVVVLVVGLLAKSAPRSTAPSPSVDPARDSTGPTRGGTSAGTDPVAAAVGRCPRCGGTRVAGAAEGLCPKCLLEIGLGTQPSGVPEGTRRVVPDAETLAREFPGLEVGELLGQGGMGLVFRARQKALDRWVALKLLPRNEASDPAFAERFHREARALARLSHPSIVAVYEFGETAGFYFLILEYVEGTDLRQALRERRLSAGDVLRIVPAICEALQFAHAHGVVHRDIKPANILLDREGRVKIADFGIAKLIGQEGPDFALTQTRQAVGTPHYMAPEQVETPQSVDHRADIYSLGVVFYEMLTGELPLGHFPPPSRKVQVDVRFDEVVLRALEKEPARRYQAASQVKSEVERISADAGGSGGPRGERGVGLKPASTPVSGGGRAGLVWPTLWVLLYGLTLLAIGVRDRGGLVGLIQAPRGLDWLFIFPVALLIAGAVAPLGVTLWAGWVTRRRLNAGTGAAGGGSAGMALALSAVLPAWGLVVVGFLVGLGMLDQIGFRGPSRFVGATLLTLITVGCLGYWGVRGVRRWLQHPKAHRLHLGAAWGVGLGIGTMVSIATLVALLVPSGRRGEALPATEVTQSQIHFPNPDGGSPEGMAGLFERGRGWRMTETGPELSSMSSPAFAGAADASAWAEANAALKRVHGKYEELITRALTRETNAAGHLVLRIPAIPEALQGLENEFWTEIDALLPTEGQRVLRWALKLRGAFGPSVSPDGSPLGTEYRNLDALFPLGDVTCTIELWKVGSWNHYRVDWSAVVTTEGNGPELPRWIQDWLKRSESPPPQLGAQAAPSIQTE